jgi:hypothetical protein
MLHTHDSTQAPILDIRKPQNSHSLSAMPVGTEGWNGKALVLYSRVPVGTVTRKLIILRPPSYPPKKQATILSHLQIKIFFFHKCPFPLAIPDYAFQVILYLTFLMLEILSINDGERKSCTSRKPDGTDEQLQSCFVFHSVDVNLNITVALREAWLVTWTDV